MKEEAKQLYGTVLAENRAFAIGLEKMQEDMNALKVLEIFRKISPEVSLGERKREDVING